MYYMLYRECVGCVATGGVKHFYSREEARAAMKKAFEGHKNIVGLPKEEDDENKVVVMDDSISVITSSYSCIWQIGSAAPQDPENAPGAALLETVGEETKASFYGSMEDARQAMQHELRCQVEWYYALGDLVSDPSEDDEANWQKLISEPREFGDFGFGDTAAWAHILTDRYSWRIFPLEYPGDKVAFTYDGKTYAMTPEEIEAAYRYQQKQYRLQDAAAQLNMFIAGVSDPDWDEPEFAEELVWFEKTHGITYKQAQELAEEFLLAFESLADCNVDENTTWQRAIGNVLSGL